MQPRAEARVVGRIGRISGRECIIRDRAIDCMMCKNYVPFNVINRVRTDRLRILVSSMFRPNLFNDLERIIIMSKETNGTVLETCNRGVAYRKPITAKIETIAATKCIE